MINTTFDVPLVKLYRRRGVVSADDPPRGLTLHAACVWSSRCWHGFASTDRPSETSPAAELSPPWVGTAYDAGRTLIVLENLVDYGGFDLHGGLGMRHLGLLARTQLLSRRRLFRTTTYRGTDVWPRALDYAAVWLVASGVMDSAGEPEPSPTSRARALEHVAITQHIKCSPNTDRSRPSKAMWDHCGAHLLAAEVEVLRPKRVIVLGTGENARALREHVLPAPLQDLARQRVSVGRRAAHLVLARGDAPWGPVQLFVAPHPASRGGTSRALVTGATAMFARSAASPT